MALAGLIATLVFGLIAVVALIDDLTGKRIQLKVRGWHARRRGERDPAWNMDTIKDLKAGKSTELPGESGWAYLTWHDRYQFEANGDFVRKTECMAMNMTDKPKDEVVFPQYSDETPAKIWARQDRRQADFKVAVDEGVAKLTISLADPVDPGDTTLIRYGYTLEGWAEEDSFYWDKIVRSPHDFWKAKLSAVKPWVITAPELTVLTIDLQPVVGHASPSVRKYRGATYWTARKPEQETRLRLTWNLVNAQTLQP